MRARHRQSGGWLTTEPAGQPAAGTSDGVRSIRARRPVVIDDPKVDGKLPYGGTVAAPIFANIGRRVAAHMNLTPTEPVSEGKDKLAGTQDQ